MYNLCLEKGETMTQYADKVAHQRKLNKLEKWRKGIKYIMSVRKTPGGVIEHTTVYNDDSQLIEYLRSKRKPDFKESPHQDDELIQEMEAQEHEAQRKLFQSI